ncbi:unnamed protein product [Rhizoctonia solani]|uniref:Uncharacterized protein n=1 Tax=Rhizoctonia solani TaxID=456999 RepID=A0A8H3DLG0_9AGAM|nr:unnamed protein product [Rhizoctonia solani]
MQAGPPWVFNDWHGRAQDIIADQASTEAGPPWVFNDWHGRAQDIIADQASTEVHALLPFDWTCVPDDIAQLPKVDDTILVAVCA